MGHSGTDRPHRCESAQCRAFVHYSRCGLRRSMDQPPAAFLGPPASLDHGIEAGSLAERDDLASALGRFDRDIGSLLFLVAFLSGESVELKGKLPG